MPVHGSKAALWVAQYNISGYSNDIAPSMTLDVVDVTGQGQVNAAPKIFIPGLLTWKLSEKGFWDYAVGTPDDIFNSLLGTLLQVIYSPSGGNAGDIAYGGYSAPFSSNSVMNPINNAVAFALEVTGSNKMSRCKVLGKVTAVGAQNGAAQDMSAGGVAGVESFLSVTAFTGTNATIKVQSSTDGVSGWADRVTHTLVTAPTSERLLQGTTTDRYLRYALTGTITSITFIIAARTVGVDAWS